MPTRSYLSQSELPVTIGIGTHPRPDEVEVTWPNGSRQKVLGVEPNTVTTVVELQ